MSVKMQLESCPVFPGVSGYGQGLRRSGPVGGSPRDPGRLSQASFAESPLVAKSIVAAPIHRALALPGRPVRSFFKRYGELFVAAILLVMPLVVYVSHAGKPFVPGAIRRSVVWV